MPLPLNTETTIGGVAVVVKSVPEKSSGPNTGGSDKPDNGADLAVSAYSGAPGGGNNSYNNPRKGLKIPDFSGLDKALGVLGMAATLINAGKSIYDNTKNLKFDFSFGSNKGKNAQSPTQIKDWWNSTSADYGIKQYENAFYDALGDDRVKLWTDFTVFGENEYFKLLNDTGGLVFPYTPTISMTHKANYSNTEGIVHSNFPFQSYKSSQIEDITVQAEFTVQNLYEGQYWLAAVHFLRTATKMFYGASTPAGFPPVVCRLSGYGTEVLPNLPVVVKSFQLDLKDNVQYLTVPSLTEKDKKNMIPMHSTMTVVVSPMYNRQLARKFNLEDYAKGKLIGY